LPGDLDCLSAHLTEKHLGSLGVQVKTFDLTHGCLVFGM